MYQNVIVVGHLGADPEMRYTPSGVPVTSFRIATSRRWTNQSGEQQEKTTWFRVTCWRKTAELAAQYLKKGRLVLVEGEIDTSAWTDRDGNPRASLELTANVVRFLGGRGEAGPDIEGFEGDLSSGENEQATQRRSARRQAADDEFPVNEDDIPF